MTLPLRHQHREKALRALAALVPLLLLAVVCGGSAARMLTNPTVAAATPLGIKDRVRQAAEVANTVAFLEDEFRRFCLGQQRSNETHCSYLTTSAVYGFLLAPFLRPELSTQDIDGLTLAQFLPRGLQSIPTPKQINEALVRAGRADPRTLTKPQAELAQALRRPESNELVFQIAILPGSAQCWGQFRDEGRQFLEGEFGKFQSQNPRGSFLEAVAAGLDPFNSMPLGC